MNHEPALAARAAHYLDPRPELLAELLLQAPNVRIVARAGARAVAGRSLHPPHELFGLSGGQVS